MHRLLLGAGIRRPAKKGAWMEWGEEVSGPMWRVREFVEVHVGEVRALDELAEVAGLSRYHFARRFRDETGEAPWAFVRRVREERAREWLEEGTAPAETAHALGFADQAHLTRALRTRFGRTPGQIRRAARDRDVRGPEGEGAEEKNRKDVQDAGEGAD